MLMLGLSFNKLLMVIMAWPRYIRDLVNATKTLYMYSCNLIISVGTFTFSPVLFYHDVLSLINLGEKADLFTSVFFNHYNPPNGFCYDIMMCNDDPIQVILYHTWHCNFIYYQ